MKVFFSWSGDESRKLANFLANWTSSVLQELEPYISTQDIDKGERWLANITANLSDIEFGILLVTPLNKESPWLLFEAGALSKNLEKSKVIPILCSLTDADLVGSPLSQFQYAKLEKDEIRNVLLSVNRSLERPLSDKTLDETFELWWPKLEGQIESLQITKVKSKRDTTKSAKEEPENVRLGKVEEAVNELLHLTRRLSFENERGAVERQRNLNRRANEKKFNQLRETELLTRNILEGYLSRNKKSDEEMTLGGILGASLDEVKKEDE